eukprot:m.208357 g.208357  ORF g.208357 m.208357 type:complete len:380 (-) comp24113_c0_seq1:121-1260(-)
MGKKKAAKAKRDDWELDMEEVITVASTPEQLAADARAAEEAAEAEARAAAEARANKKMRLVVSEVAGEGAGRTKHRVAVTANDTLATLGAEIESTTGIAVAEQVVVFKGSRLDLTSTEPGGVGAAGLANQSKMTLMTAANAAAAALATSDTEPTEPLLLVAIEQESNQLSQHDTEITAIQHAMDRIIGQWTPPTAATKVPQQQEKDKDKDKEKQQEKQKEKEKALDASDAKGTVGVAVNTPTNQDNGAAGAVEVPTTPSSLISTVSTSAMETAMTAWRQADTELVGHVAEIEKLQLRLDRLRIAKQQTAARDARKALIGRSTNVLTTADACRARLKRGKDVLNQMTEVVQLLGEYDAKDAGRSELEEHLAESLDKLRMV